MESIFAEIFSAKKFDLEEKFLDFLKKAFG
jgi:hypothetical protein